MGAKRELASWEREARRLRFSDPDWERRFRDERFAQSQTRVRVMLVVAMFVVVGMGLGDVVANVRDFPEYVSLSLAHRFFYIVPIWMIMLISTGLPGHQRRATWLNPVGVVVVMWAVAVLKWRHGLMFRDAYVTSNVFGDIAGIMFISVFTLPMLFRATLGMLVVGCAGIVGLFALFEYILPQVQTVVVLGSSLAGTGTVVLALAWHREVGDRRDFAQREIMAGLNRELSRLNAEKNEFMTIAAHDLRSPLAAVGGMVNGLRAGQFDGAEKTNTAHQAILEMTKRMLGLVDDYLGAHAMEHGTLPVRLGPSDLGALAAEVKQRFVTVAQGKGQTLRFKKPEARVMAQADEALLGQILDNFVSNALKFSPEGAEVEIGLLQSEDGRRVRIEVVDQGPGVPVAEQHRLFRMFGRTSVQPTAGEKSHGIGLAVTRRLAEAMGGAVGCDSPVTEAGTGAAFWVELRAR